MNDRPATQPAAAHVLPEGEGFAHFLIDYGPESDLYWTIFVTDTGEIWTYANKHVRASKNITLGRTLSKEAVDALTASCEAMAIDLQIGKRVDLTKFTCMKCGQIIQDDAVTGTRCGCAEGRGACYKFPQL